MSVLCLLTGENKVSGTLLWYDMLLEVGDSDG